MIFLSVSLLLAVINPWWSLLSISSIHRLIVCKVIIFPLAISFLAFALIAPIHFSQGLRQGEYGLIVIMEVFISFKCLFIKSLAWILALSHIIHHMLLSFLLLFILVRNFAIYRYHHIFLFPKHHRIFLKKRQLRRTLKSCHN